MRSEAKCHEPKGGKGECRGERKTIAKSQVNGKRKECRERGSKKPKEKKEGVKGGGVRKMAETGGKGVVRWLRRWFKMPGKQSGEKNTE